MDERIVGPPIPPHILAKRKREAKGGAAVSPKAESFPAEGLDVKKRRTVVGPAPPPASLDERPNTEPEGDSSSDDDIGPALPPDRGAAEDAELAAQRRLAKFAEIKAQNADDSKPKRDEWMLVPPKSEDWTSKVDPTKLRNRKFQTGKGSKAPRQPGADNTLWTESPDERRKRLDDEVMGVKKPATQLEERGGKQTISAAEAGETARRIREFNSFTDQYEAKNRSKSLYDEHKKAGPREKDDDPSARVFDREKDIAGGQRIGHTQKKEMLDRAAQFGSRFSSGSYL